MEKLELVFSDEDKKLYATEDPGLLVAVYRDEMTANNGLKRGVVSGKGTINNRMTNILMRLLEREGIPTAFVRETGDCETLVRRVERFPLEVIVRNRAAGSICRRLGVPEGTTFSHPVVEFCHKDEDLDDPLVNESHITAMGWAKAEELGQMTDVALRVNSVLVDFFRAIRVELIDFKLEFGTAADGSMLIADEISPDTCRLWDSETHESLDKDRFRRSLGDVEEAYQEIWHRLQQKIACE